MVKKSNHIRIREDDKTMWGEYCKKLGMTSPDLFNKVMKSPKIKLNQRILEEIRIKDECFRKKIMFQNGKKFN